jgi:hypothetical protein
LFLPSLRISSMSVNFYVITMFIFNLLLMSVLYSISQENDAILLQGCVGNVGLYEFPSILLHYANQQILVATTFRIS